MESTAKCRVDDVVVVVDRVVRPVVETDESSAGIFAICRFKYNLACDDRADAMIIPRMFTVTFG